MSSPAPALSPAPTLAITPRPVPQREQLAKAAKQFEAIFVRQMLAGARAAKPAGKDELLGGQAMETFAQMRDERFAEIAAERGAFGVAKAIEVQLGVRLAPAAPGEIVHGSAPPRPLFSPQTPDGSPLAGGETGSVAPPAHRPKARFNMSSGSAD